jgi:hypothetical protein
VSTTGHNWCPQLGQLAKWNWQAEGWVLIISLQLSALDPAFAVFAELFFPNGDDFLDSIYGKAAGFEGLRPMSSGNYNGDTAFTMLHSAQAMHNGYVRDWKAFFGFGSDLLKFFKRHGFIGFILEIKHLFAAGIITNGAEKNDGGSVLTPKEMFLKRSDVNRFASEAVHV